MRLLFLFLLLLNVGFFAWQFQKKTHEHVNVQKEVTSDNKVQKLVLISELKNNTELEKPSQPESLSESPPETQPESPPASNPEPHNEIAQDQNQNQNPDQTQQPQNQTPQQEITEPVQAQKFACYTLGPFSDLQTRAEMSLLLGKSGIVTETRESEDKKISGYWVHLPVDATLAAANKTLQDLQDRKITDVSIVPLEGGQYTLSLGVFSTGPRAKRRYGQFVKIGYTPLIDERYKASTSQWLDIKDAKSSALIPGVVWRDFAVKFPGVSMQEIDC